MIDTKLVGKRVKNITEFAEIYFRNLSSIFKQIDLNKLLKLEKTLLNARLKKKIFTYLETEDLPQQHLQWLTI